MYHGYIDTRAIITASAATCDSNRSFGPQEIIEWPVVVVDTQLQKEVACFHKYVRPVHQPQLTAFCTELTGIEVRVRRIC